MGTKAFQVLILHGHSNERYKLKELVEALGFTPRLLEEEYEATTIFQQLQQTLEDVCAVIVLMSADDPVQEKFRARQNVIFEMGYCFGAFDYDVDFKRYSSKDAIIVVADEHTESFANIDGLKKIFYQTGKLGLKKKEIGELLQRTYKKAIDVWPDYFKD